MRMEKHHTIRMDNHHTIRMDNHHIIRMDNHHTIRLNKHNTIQIYHRDKNMYKPYAMGMDKHYKKTLERPEGTTKIRIAKHCTIWIDDHTIGK